MARTWFTSTTTAASVSELSVLNRAARCYANEQGADALTDTVLSKIRNTFKPGMSARAVVDKIYDEES